MKKLADCANEKSVTGASAVHALAHALAQGEKEVQVSEEEYTSLVSTLCSYHVLPHDWDGKTVWGIKITIQ